MAPKGHQEEKKKAKVVEGESQKASRHWSPSLITILDPCTGLYRNEVYTVTRKEWQTERYFHVHADKTFGMKNKSKSAKVQQFVKQLEASMKPSIKEQRLAEPSVKDKKAAEAAKQKELNDLFAVAIKQPKVPAGVWHRCECRYID